MSVKMLLKSKCCRFLVGGICAITLCTACVACKSAPQTSPDGDAPVAADCSVSGAPDALTAISRWAELDAQAQALSDPARALRASWSTLYVARAWRVDGAHWMALLSDTRDPAPDAEALLLSVTRQSDGTWAASMPAQVTRADVLWPQL